MSDAGLEEIQVLLGPALALESPQLCRAVKMGRINASIQNFSSL